MNRSGDIIDTVMRRTGTDVENMILICDNMDLKPGLIRLKKKGSSAGHNGIKSIIENMGTSDFIRLYIGVDRPAAGESIVEHVLSGFNDAERSDFDAAVSVAADALISLKDKKP